MKKIPFFLLIFSFLLLTSCGGSDDAEIEESIFIADNPTGNGNPETPTTENILEERVETPCEFDLSNVKEGDVILINCTLDLKGENINLPARVTLNYDKGDIINGTLNFSNGGKIDSRLLNISLEVVGDVQLLTNDFEFFPSRWDIVEGSVTRAVAFTNHENIQKAIDLIKFLTPQPTFEKSEFSISRLDAFFESNSNAIGVPVILMPSDINFNMSRETFLRVFPVNDPMFTSRMIRLVGVKNVNVTGGNIIGDRRERTSSTVGNVLFGITGGQNIMIDNVTMNFGSITGLTVNSIGRLGNPIDDGTDYLPSKDVTIKNCIFDSNRSNNLSITDGEDITVMNCRLYRAGIDIGQSIGAAPRIGIVIEPVLGQRVERVRIIDNIVEESSGNSILAAFGNDIFISGNTTQKGVGWNGASNVMIVNNPSIGGVLAGDDNAFNLSQSTGNIVRENTIQNVPTGILASNDDIIIERNNIINCKVGMQLRNLRDSKILNNTIISNVENSFGINTQIAVDNVFIEENNTIRLEKGRAFSIEGINNDDENKLLVIRDNVFDCSSQGRINFSSGVTLFQNRFENSGFGITNSKNIVIERNRVTSVNDNQHAFFINNSSAVSNIEVKENTFINTSAQVAYGIRLFIVGGDNLANTSTNIVIRNNTIRAAGFGIHSVNFNGVTIRDNRIDIEDNCCNGELFFRGNNALLTGNSNSSGGALQRPDIQGFNNQL